MASTEAELEQQLKEAGKQLSHPPDSVDELLPVLDQVEKLLSKVDQSPKKSMLDALKPSMRALIQDNLSGHSDVDVKVAVASCISEITRITAPDAPYNDDQMRDVFQLIVSSFEDLSDQSSRSYNKRASILETVSKVRSCVIMLDLECDELIVEMFEHFLKSVRDYHLESIYSSMENIMILVLEESEEVSVEMLKPILATVKKDNQGVLPIARKLGEGVLLKSATKLKPFLMPAVIDIGDTLDMYTQVVASVCEGTTPSIEQNDENASGVQLANESKSTKESLDDTQQADESKLTTASSDHTDQVVKEDNCQDDEDPNLDRSPKSVMSNGVKADEEVSVDQEPSKKPQEDKNEVKDTDDESDADVAKPELKPEETSKSRGTKSDTIVNSEEPSDSSHVEGEKEEAEKQPDVHTSPVKESSNDPSEMEKDENAPESKNENENVSSPSHSQSQSQSESLPDESQVKKTVRSKRKQTPQKDETTPASPSRTGRSKNKAVVAKEVKIPATIEESEDGGAASDSDDDKPLKKVDKKVDTGSSGAKSSKGKKGKQSGGKKQGKKVDVKKVEEDSDSDTKPLKLSVKKGEKSKVESKSVEEDEESDSDSKPIKVSGKKGNSGNLGDGKSSSKKKDEGKKRGSGKNVAEKEQTKSLSDDDEMEESSPKTATKKVEGNSKETPGNSSKRKRNTTGKEKVKYDKSLVGLKVKVWWPEDKTYYEGVIESFDSAKKKHKVSYVDGDEEILNLKTQKWETLEEFSQRDEEQDSEDQNEEEASLETHKKKKSKTDPTPSASQEKTKDSSKRGGATSSSAKTKGSTKDNKSTPQKKSTEGGKSKEDEETPKSKTVNKSKGKTPQTGTKSNSNGPGKGKSGSEDVKTPETPKGGSKSGKKRKKRS